MAAGAERAGFEEFVAPNGNKKLRCRLTGHEIADRPEAIEAHLASRRYRIAAAKVPKESVAEWEKHYIVPSKNGGHGRGVLYCTLTRTHLNAVKEELEAHIQGRRYKAALERMQARGKAPKAEGEEPSSDEEDDERAEGDEGEIPLIDDGDEAGDEEAEADEEVDDGVEEVPAEEARPFAVRAKPDGKRKKREREAVAEVAAVPAAGDDKARRRQGEAKEAKAEAKSAEAKAVPPKKAKAEAAVVETEAPQPKKAKAKEAAAQAEAEEPKKAKAKAKEAAAAAQAEAEEARQAKKAKAKAKEAAEADLGFEEVPASRPSHVNRANVASDDDDEAVEKRLVARIFG